MPRAWTDKDERRYEHVRQSVRARGMGEKRAKEVAARTVNKRRRLEGRTPQASTQGTGNPRLPLEKRSKRELYNRAREMGIEGRSALSKAELATAIRARES